MATAAVFRWLILTWLAGVSLSAADAAILKVLPSLLDHQGRASLAPSLYERDAYQAQLRKKPEQVAGLRMDVRWRAPRSPAGTLKLRLELRGSQSDNNGPLIIEQTVSAPRWGSSWTRITLDADARRQLGDLVAWKASLKRGDQECASIQSFLW
jgi:hypothetical protein